MKVVLDTNVLLSGLMSPEGVPGRIVAAWVESRFDAVFSLDQLAEIGRVLEYPKIRRKLGWDERQIEEFIKQIYLRAEVIEPRAVPVEALRDAGDVPILATLVATGADVLVTGDRDLLEVRSRYPIETPAEFVRRL